MLFLVYNIYGGIDMKSIVKRYYPKQDTRDKKRVVHSCESQVNTDLLENPNWEVRQIQVIKEEGFSLTSMYVVFNVYDDDTHNEKLW